MEDKAADHGCIPGVDRVAAGNGSRTAAALGTLLTVAAGLGVRSVAGGDVAKYAGDALYTVLIYALVLVVVPRARPLTAGGTALAVSWAVELAQLTGVPEELARQSTVARLVLGSTFNAPDLFWYGAGAGLAWGVHTWTAATRTRRLRRF